ncbi:MAG TPA: LacI family DNA-binding transcriptional regulator [Microlunatus sp.]|nr:LacI family DNA-binding transcriptional regulator [Microlunatus sp.]
MATIYDVARRAGVSPATVSRVFNGVRVTEEKARLVRQAALELDFTPSRPARALRRRNSEIIALIIPDIENPFFASLARGVEDVAQVAGYSVVLCNSDEDESKERRYLEIAASEQMSGVILAAAGDGHAARDLVAKGRRVVAVDRALADLDVDAVLIDGRSGARLATQTLLAQGFQRIACITGPQHAESARSRAEGWADVVGRDAGAARLLRHTDYRLEGGERAIRELLALPEPPDALFAANNLTGLGALRVLHEEGLTPPGFGLAVFGDLPFTAPAPAEIITVQSPSRHLGETAARLLLDRIGGDDQPPRTVMLRASLATR